MQSLSGNCYPALDLVLRKPIFLIIVFFFRGVFFHTHTHTPVCCILGLTSRCLVGGGDPADARGLGRGARRRKRLARARLPRALRIYLSVWLSGWLAVCLSVCLHHSSLHHFITRLIRHSSSVPCPSRGTGRKRERTRSHLCW